MNELLTRKELMNLVTVKTTQTIRNWEKQGMPVIRKGKLMPRYNLADVIAWLTSNEEVSL